MEIRILFEDGSYVVRTDTGIRQPAETEEEAVSYANGLQDGYNAAARKLGRAQWQVDRSVIAQRAKINQEEKD